jgi:putative transposase
VLSSPRGNLILDNLALRQQLLALHSKRPRPRLGRLDKLFWVAMKNMWPGWRKSLILVTPETVVRGIGLAFGCTGHGLSRTRRFGGRKPLTKELRDLIFRMVTENPTWGAPRIHGELLKLGFAISERT